MSWDNECVDCDRKISDDYERCYECNDTYRSEDLPIAYESIKIRLPVSWIFIIRKSEVQLPHSECTLDEESNKVWVPRWLAEAKEIDNS